MPLLGCQFYAAAPQTLSYLQRPILGAAKTKQRALGQEIRCFERLVRGQFEPMYVA